MIHYIDFMVDLSMAMAATCIVLLFLLFGAAAVVWLIENGICKKKKGE